MVVKHLREENRLKVFQNRILRRIFGPNRDPNVPFTHCCQGDKVLKIKMGRSCSQNERKILRGKPTGKRPLGRPRRRWEDSIRMDLKGNGINTWNWVDSAQCEDY